MAQEMLRDADGDEGGVLRQQALEGLGLWRANMSSGGRGGHRKEEVHGCRAPCPARPTHAHIPLFVCMPRLRTPECAHTPAVPHTRSATFHAPGG